MTFQNFIENAKQLQIGMEYPYLPSPKSPESKKYKLLEVSEESIKVERDGTLTTISIPHIRTLLENMSKNIPLDVEKTLGSGGNTRSIEESILCLMPTIFYTRINNRKHIVESNDQEHEIGVIMEWAGAEALPVIKAPEDNYSKRYLNSLLAKPFVILAGNSGTGKTRIANKLTELYDVKISDYNKSLKDLFNFILENNYDINGVRLKSVSDTSIEVYNTKNKYICISFGIIQEYVDWYSEHGISANPVRADMQEQGKYDGQSYSWDTTHIEKIARFLCDYQKKEQSIVYTSNHLLIPVGADWTDNTKILGYYNPLAANGTGKYEKTDVFRFIERAGANPDIPFFLILDEMNLSHVERYFSDFLSKMELLDYSNPDNKIFFDITGYGKLEFPKNLFITGTVNIDETTYMFSPKVLDRANVIEFVPDSKNVLKNFKEDLATDEIEPANDGSAEGFLALAKVVRKKTTLPDGADKAVDILTGISDILTDSGFEFAYRTAKEIRLYLNAAAKLAENEGKKLEDKDYISLMDEQLLQKILPKIHGNRSQIGGLLKQLADFCELKEEKSDGEPKVCFDLPLSKKKIDCMIKQLETTQFASFI